jgi:fatty acid-binding protein DegV
MQKKNDVLMDFLSTFGQPEIGQEVPKAVTESRGNGVMCDAAADLPAQLTATQDIVILPTQVKFGDEVVLDKQGAYEQTKGLDRPDSDFLKAEVRALDANALTNKLSSKFALQFDSVLVVCTHHAFIDTGSQMRAFMHKAREDMKWLRKSRGMKPEIEVVIHDSKSVFCGTGIQAVALREFVKQGLPFSNLRRTAERLAESTHVLFVPGDTKAFGRNLKRAKDINVDPWSRACSGLTAFSPVLGCLGGSFSALSKSMSAKKSIAMVLTELNERVFQGLSVPHMLLSYGGDPSALEQWPEFTKLEQTCAEMDVKLTLTPTGITSRVLATPGSFCAGFITNSADSSAFVSTLGGDPM